MAKVRKQKVNLQTSPIYQTSSEKTGHKWKAGSIGCHLNRCYILIKTISHYSSVFAATPAT